MAETIPRWHLPAVEFLETDAETIKAEIITCLLYTSDAADE